MRAKSVLSMIIAHIVCGIIWTYGSIRPIYELAYLVIVFKGKLSHRMYLGAEAKERITELLEKKH